MQNYYELLRFERPLSAYYINLRAITKCQQMYSSPSLLWLKSRRKHPAAPLGSCHLTVTVFRVKARLLIPGCLVLL